jgi:sirohydrochlorin ferrochelatase
VVPLLLTAAYHGRVDIPGALTAARAGGLRMPLALGDVLGPADGVVDELLLAGLRRRLAASGLDVSAGEEAVDAIVLAAAGTRDAAARRTVDAAAAALGASLGVPCLAAYASAAAPTAGGAVARLRTAGARRVAMAAYFLAPGRLYDVAVASARAAGAVAVAAPLEGAPELARLVLARVDAAARWRSVAESGAAAA